MSVFAAMGERKSRWVGEASWCSMNDFRNQRQGL
jgi:hypothetical protein